MKSLTSACTLPERYNVVRVSSECVDVGLDPLKSTPLVSEAVVTGITGLAKLFGCQVSQNPESITAENEYFFKTSFGYSLEVDCNDRHPIFHRQSDKASWVILWPPIGAHEIPTAVDEDHHR